MASSISSGPAGRGYGGYGNGPPSTSWINSTTAQISDAARDEAIRLMQQRRLARSNAKPLPPIGSSKNEGYYQPALVEGMGEVVRPHHNPPEAIPVTVTRNKFTGSLNPPAEYIPVEERINTVPAGAPFIPGMEPPGAQPVAEPPLGASTPQYNLWQNVKAGFDQGWDYAVESKPWSFSRSAVWHRAPEDKWQGLNTGGRVGFVGGRIAGDVLGEGSRSLVWRIHPLDLAGTTAMEGIKRVGGNRSAQILGMAAATNATSIMSGNMNYFNPDEAFRPTGFAATSPDEDDPSQTTNVPLEYFNRMVLGRTGRLLPWQEFHQERPNVDYQTYEAYQNYLRDQGILGLAKGTMDGVDGPEARIMGYRVTIPGAIAGLAAVGGGVLATKRIAGLRK